MKPLCGSSRNRCACGFLLLCLVAASCVSRPSNLSGQGEAEESANWYPRRQPDATFREVDEEGGLVALPGKSEVKVLNAVGIRVFALIDGTRTPEQVAQAVFDEFEVDYETALADTYAFLDELEQEGMLAEAIPIDVRKRVGLELRPASAGSSERSK